jgi:large subunit ribosomal protein L16
MKRQKGRVSKVPKQEGQRLGDYAIISKEPGRLSKEQMASVVMTLKRKMGQGTKIVPRVYGHLAVTKKPLEVRMGKGKGTIAKRIGRIRANTVIVEIHGTAEEGKSMAGLEAAASKLPVRVTISRRKSTY